MVHDLPGVEVETSHLKPVKPVLRRKMAQFLGRVESSKIGLVLVVYC